jgi:hypothetical protein
MKFEPLVESIARVRRLSRNARPALLRLRDTPQVRAPVLGRQAPGLALSGREEPALAHRRARDPPRQGRSPAQRAAQSPGTRRVTGMAGPPRRPPQQAERDQRPRVTSRTGEQLVGALSKIVTAVMARAGIAESPHALRHTVATRLVRDSAHGPVLVADIVGHADTETTRRYALSDLESAAPAFGDLAD